LLEAAREGESRTLVLRGEAGSGKTALLDRLVERASGFRIAQATGVESEMELPYATLHQLCAPLLDGLGRLPPPQREALGSVFGLSAGGAPDRFAVGLATLGLLSDAADAEPLLCLVDDAQWCDRASAQVLAFVARRLAADPVALVFATRVEVDELAGLPELAVEGLPADDARALLDSVLTGPIDEQVKDRIVAETRGNPLALLELPRGSTPAELAGGFSLGAVGTLSGRIEQSFRRRIEALPSPTRTVLLVAAAEPVGEPVLIERAAGELGVGGDLWRPATEAQLVELGARVRFRHPLVRSAAYRAASPEQRRRAHQALADATDPTVDPDRRAWHRADATLDPDESIAADLEGSATRAQGRGGVAAAAAFLERAAALTPEPSRRATRALAAAEAKQVAGAPEAGLRLLAMAEAGPLDELERARADRLRARIAFAQSRGRDAPPLLLRAAKQLEPLDPRLARETYLEALAAAQFAGSLAIDGELSEAARAARGAPRPGGAPRPLDLLLDGLALLIGDGYAAAGPTLREALAAFRREDLPKGEALRWSWLACRTAIDLWDFATWDVLSARLLTLAREDGALAALPFGLGLRLSYELHAGNFARAAALGEEQEEVTRATGSRLAPYGEMLLAGWRGPEAEALAILEASAREVRERGEGIGLTFALRMTATLYNGLGRYDKALAAAEQASRRPQDLNFANEHWSSWSRRPPGSGTSSAPRPRSHGSPGRQDPPRATGDWGSRRAHGRCSRTARMPSRSTARRSSGWSGPASGSSSRAPACSTASGCAAKGGGSMPASSCAPRTTGSKRSGSAPSRIVRPASSRPPARPPGSAPRRPATTSLRARPRSRASPARAFRTRRSRAGSSSARARSSTTSARSSPNWGSPRAASSATSWTTTPEGARTPASALGVTHAFEHGDLADLGGLEVIPEDAAGAVVLAVDLDHRAGGGDDVAGEVVGGDHQVLAEDLDRVDGGGDDDVGVDLARLDEDPVLEVVVAAAFADPGAAEVDGDGAAEDEVDLRQVIEGDDAAVLQGALDRGRLLDRFFGELLRVEDAEGVGVAQARHRHDHRLAFFEGEAARVGLRRVRVGLDDHRPFPEPVAGELFGRQFGPGEVRDAALGARKAGDPLVFHGLPDLGADFVLGAHGSKHIPQ
jgi:AAA ATPase-like protein